MDLLERASFSRMQDTLAEVMHGHGRVALVTGETGIGKTSLVEHFAERQKNGCQVLWGGCDALFTPRPPRPLYNIAHHFVATALFLLERSSSCLHLFPELQNHTSTPLVIEDVQRANETTLIC